MKIKLTSVYVDDQDKALRFYTEVLGFTKKTDFSQGPYRWLTVASREEPDGTELQLALNNNPAAKAYQQAMFQRRLRADQGPRRRVYDAAHRRDRFDHCDAERHLRQPHSAHPAGMDAQRRLYRLKPEPLQEVDVLLALFRRFWSAHVDALERHLDRMDQSTRTKKKKRKRRRKR